MEFYLTKNIFINYNLRYRKMQIEQLQIDEGQEPMNQAETSCNMFFDKSLRAELLREEPVPQVDAEKLSQLIQLKDQISELAIEIRKHIEGKYEPVDALNKLNFLLDAHYDDIWTLINLPYDLVVPADQQQQQQPPAEVQDGAASDEQITSTSASSEQNQAPSQQEIYKPKNVKLEFYHNVLGAISSNMLNEMSVQKPQYLREIMAFFMIILDKYYIRDLACQELCVVVQQIFDWKRNLHQRVFPGCNTNEYLNMDFSMSDSARRVQAEKSWRENELKVGDKIDVMKPALIRDLLVNAWSRGTVIFKGQIEGDQSREISASPSSEQQPIVVQVEFEHDRDAQKSQFNLMDAQIAPLGTFTNDWEWRYDIKVGDHIDCIDHEKDWYKSTVLEERITKNPDGQDIREVYVGFRTYDEEGSKTDEEGNKFFGWSEKYDEWLGVTATQIQRFNSCHLQYRKVESANRQYDRSLDFDDREDTLASNKEIVYFGAARQKFFGRSQAMADCLNRFGQAKGFHKILQLFLACAEGELKLSMGHIVSIVGFLMRTQPLWHKQFAVKFIDAFNEAFLKCVCYVNMEATDSNKNTIILGPMQEDSFDSAELEMTINQLVDPILKRFNTLEMIAKIQQDHLLNIGNALMKLPNLKKRIQGLKYINEAIKSVRSGYQQQKLMTNKDMIVQLRKLGVMQRIFGENTHFQLVHRSSDIIRLFFSEKEIRESEIDMIWDLCVKQGQQIKLEVYKSILEAFRHALSCMTDETKEHFIGKLEKMAPADVVEKDIEVLTELGKKGGVAFRQPENYVMKAAQILWQIATLQKNYPRAMAPIARKKFCDQVRSWDDSLKADFVFKCIQNIQNCLYPLQSLKIAMNLIDKMSQGSYSNSKKTREDFCREIIEQSDFANLIITDLDRYITYSNSLVKKGELTAENHQTLELTDQYMFNHLKNLKSRLKRLKTILIYAKVKLQSEQIERIWDILINKSELREVDQNIFFNWFKSALGKDQKKLLSEELMVNLFRKKIVPSDLSMLKSLRVNGLECIVRLFVLVNENQGNVLDMDPQTNSQDGGNWYPYSGNYQSYNSQDDSGSRSRYNKFKINVMPDQLEGINILWSVLESCDSSNQNLLLMVQRTLINIYSNLSSQLDNRRSEIYDMFVISCLACLKNVKDDTSTAQIKESKSDAKRKESIKFICQMITAFFESTEENGIGRLRMHKQLQDGEFLERIMVETKVPIRRGADANFIELHLYSNISMWNIRNIVARFTNQSPLCIEIKRGDTKKPNLRDFRNCKMMSELKFASKEELSVVRARPPDLVKMPLVDKDGNLIPELKKIIESWFETYSKELTKEEILEMSKDDPRDATRSPEELEERRKMLQELPPTVRCMTRETCVQFAEAVTTITNIDVTDYRVNNTFEKHSRKLGAGQLLVAEEFLRFYEQQSKEKEEVVRQNLMHQGIQIDMKNKIDFNRLNIDNDERVVKDESILPRSKLAQNNELFGQLMALVNQLQGDEAEGVWNLLMSLETNKQIQESIMNIEDLEALFDIREGNFYKILYSLQIIQSLINEYKLKKEGRAILWIETMNQDLPSQIPSSSEQPQPEGYQVIAAEPNNSKANSMQVETYEQDFPELDSDASPKQYLNQGTSPEPEPQSWNQGGNTNVDEPQDANQVYQGQAIPMPYNGPLLPQSTQAAQNHDVPMAPRSAAAAIGAPNATNTIQHFRSLQDFQGHKRVIPIINSPAGDEAGDALRRQWLPKFLKKGGLKKLISLLKELSRFHNETEKEGSTGSKVAKRCLSELMETLKVLLISSFCASSSDKEVALSLQRKMSSHADDPASTQIDSSAAKDESQQAKDDKKKNKLQEEQESTVEMMKPLIDLLRNTDDLESLQTTLGLDTFQEELLGILAEFMLKKEYKTEDREIMNQGLSIWMSCVASEPKLLNGIFANAEGSAIVEGETNSQKFSKIMIEKGLVSLDHKVRDHFQGAIRFIVEQIKSDQLVEKPLMFFVKVLISKMDFVMTQAGSARHTRPFFATLRELLPQYFDQVKHDASSQIFEPAQLIASTVRRLQEYEPSEKRNSFIEDYTLIGWLDVISILIERNPDCMDKGEVEGLARTILETCLFSHNFEPIEGHITQDVNLEPIEKKNINKCHAKESVQAAYDLLLTLCRTQPSEFTVGILENHWLKQIYQIDKPQKAGFAPLSGGRAWNGFCGIKNLGAVCYMNSMIQQFYNVPTLRYCLLAAHDDQPENIAVHEGQEIDDNVLHQLMNMFGFLQLSDRQYYNPTPFCFSFKSFDGQPTNVREQKDAQEFLNLGFDRLENLLSKTSQKYLLQNVFGGQTMSMMKCKNCGNLRQNKEDFYNLSLEVKNQHTLHESLRKFVSGEIISDYQCEACNQRVELEKKVTLEKLPNTLIVHLQRIIFDFDTLRNQKLNDRVEFPNVLSLKEFTTEEILKKDRANEAKERMAKKMSQQKSSSKQEDGKEEEPLVEEQQEQIVEMVVDEEAQSDEEKQGDENEADLTEYKLVGVCCHMGSADAGHYLSYINVERNTENSDNLGQKSREEWLSTEKQKWREFNDSSVSSFSFDQLEQTCFGGQQNQNAYMLIYERRVKEKMKIVIPKDVMPALGCDGTAMTSADAFDNHLFQVFPKLREQLTLNKDLITYDQEKDEHTVQVDFDDARKFVPNSIYRKVHTDNLKFLCEKQVFSDTFYKSTLELLQICICKNESGDIANDKAKFELLFKIIDRVVFDLLVNSAANLALKGTADLLLVMLSKSDEAVQYLTQHRVFAPKESLGKDEKDFFEMLCSHQDKDVRDMASQTLCFLLNRLLQIGGDQNMAQVDEIVTRVLDLMPNECQKHWMRIDCYLGFIRDLAKSNVGFLNILAQKRTVTRLMDLMCKYNPNSMLFTSTSPPLENLVLAVSFIVRSIPCLVDPLDPMNAPPSEDIDQATWCMTQAHDRGPSPSHTPLSQLYPLDNVGNQQIQLPEDCLKSLFIHQKQFKIFYENSSKFGFGAKEYPHLISHLCFKNKEYSRKIAKHILKGISRSNADDISLFLELMKHYLLIEDEFFEQRLEWIFGVADQVVKTSNYAMYNQPPKVGVAYADSIGAQVCRYFTPIYKSASSLYGTNESALQALLSNKRSQTVAVLSSLKYIFEAITEDKSGRILGYLQTMDPHSYQFARYWDWIRPWVQNEVEQNTRNQHIPAYRAELELSINVLSLVEKVEQDQSERNGNFKVQQQPGDIIQYPENDGGPKPYVIWDLEREEVIGREEQHRDKVAVYLTESLCSVSLSMPNGDTNFALLDTFQQSSNYQGSQGGIRSAAGSVIHRKRFGRGSGGKRVGTGRLQNSKLRQKYQRKVEKDKTDNDADSECALSSNSNGSRDQEMGVSSQKATGNAQDPDPQETFTTAASISNQRNVRFADEQDYTENNQEIQDNLDFKLLEEDQQMTQEPERETTEPQPAEGTSAVPSALGSATNPVIVENQQDAEIQNEESGQIGQQNEEEQNFQQYQSKCLLQFKVENSSNEAKTIEFIIKPKLDANGNPSKLNFRCPLSVIPCQVFSSSTTDIIHLTKLDPDVDSWGDFEWEFRVLEKPNNNYVGSYPPASGQGNQYTGGNGDYHTGGGTGAQDNYDFNMNDDGAGVASADEKQCAFCTYLNPAILRQCEMCGNVL